MENEIKEIEEGKAEEGKKVKKDRKKLKRFLSVAAGVAFVAILAGICLIYQHYYTIRKNVYFYKDVSVKEDRVDISMTKEERLKDFEKAYEYAFLSNPNLEGFEKKCGVDYSEMYEEYKGYVAECEDEFDYYFVLISFLRNLPSGHTGMLEISPSYLRTLGFEMNAENGLSFHEDDYLNAWANYLKEACLRYDFENTTNKRYVLLDGEFRYADNDEKYEGSKLLKINGEDLEDSVMEPLQYYLLIYEGKYDEYYRNGYMLNDRYGEPVIVTIQMKDGTIVEEESFIDNKYSCAYDLYEQYYYEPPVQVEEDTKEEEEQAEYKEYKPYEIAVDEENDTVYLYFDECTVEGMQNFDDEFEEALEGHDNVIIDIRDNGGGAAVYCSWYLYPHLFTDEMTLTEEIVLTQNDVTEKWARMAENKKKYNVKDNKDGTYTYYQTYEFKGDAKKEYNIYVLTSHSTFSSGDLIASVLGSKDNVTLIGDNTKGEGREGLVFTALLPESHLVIGCMPGKNANVTPADGIYGTAPDIYSILSNEDVDKKMELKEMKPDENVNKYENRKYWDSTLNETLELIQNNR